MNTRQIHETRGRRFQVLKLMQMSKIPVTRGVMVTLVESATWMKGGRGAKKKPYQTDKGKTVRDLRALAVLGLTKQHKFKDLTYTSDGKTQIRIRHIWELTKEGIACTMLKFEKLLTGKAEKLKHARL